MKNTLFLISIFLSLEMYSQCNTNEIEVVVDITPDNYPSETSWDVVVQGGSTMSSGTFNSDTFCLSDANCYEFTIYDQVGDGICCGFGNGSYALYVDGFMIVTGGSFGSSETTNFNCAPVGHNLPLVMVNTNGQTIVDEPGIIADMGIIDNGGLNYITDPFNDYNGYVDIEIRGQSSQWFPKKNYGFETVNQFGVDIDVSLLGYPVEEDWILHGPYSDKSLLRNSLALNMAKDMGYYASRTRHCELYINNNYRGVYLLMEKIKRDGDRVDIAKLDSSELSGDDLTGGYIFRIDKGSDPGWLSQYGVFSTPWNKIKFKYVYPKANNIMPQQEAYIKNYVDSMEYAIASPDFTYAGKRYDEYLEIRSFVDNYIINELAKNVDAYRISSYFYKDKSSNGGKLMSMPVWDYNLAFFNGNYCNGDDYTGWIYDEHCDDGNPFWLNNMRQDTAFQDVLKCRWDMWKDSILDNTYLHNFIDSIVIDIDSAQQRNFVKWPILGTYVWPNPTPLPTTYQGEINRVKNFLTNRINWMDNNILGSPDCSLYDTVTIKNTNTEINQRLDFGVKIYPNPTTDYIVVSSNKYKVKEILIYNVLGELIQREESTYINSENWELGVYLVKVFLMNDRQITIKVNKQ